MILINIYIDIVYKFIETVIIIISNKLVIRNVVRFHFHTSTYMW